MTPLKWETPITDRPGVQLDHRVAQPVHVTRNGRQIHVGWIDPKNRVYQWGGDLSTHVYWKRRVLALGPEECKAIKQAQPSRLEFIADGKTLYAISIEDARTGEWYEGEGGRRRFGIPLDLFTVET